MKALPPDLVLACEHDLAVTVAAGHHHCDHCRKCDDCCDCMPFRSLEGPDCGCETEELDPAEGECPSCHRCDLHCNCREGFDLFEETDNSLGLDDEDEDEEDLDDDRGDEDLEDEEDDLEDDLDDDDDDVETV